jgi:hypothetical protein
VRALLLLCLTGCVTVAPKPVIVPSHHFVAGLLLYVCDTIRAAELVDDQGHIYFVEPGYVSADKWGIMMLSLQALNDESHAVELLPGCTRT